MVGSEGPRRSTPRRVGIAATCHKASQQQSIEASHTMQFLLYPLVIVAGMMNPLQAACTSALNKALDRPFMVGVISVVGTATVTIVGSLVLDQLGFGGKAGQVPWWAWFGGLAGSVFLLTQPVAAPKMGAGPFIATTVTAGMVVSVLIDNYGWLGFQQHTATLWRLVGAGLMIVGVVLVGIF